MTRRVSNRQKKAETIPSGSVKDTPPKEYTNLQPVVIEPEHVSTDVQRTQIEPQGDFEGEWFKRHNEQTKSDEKENRDRSLFDREFFSFEHDSSFSQGGPQPTSSCRFDDDQQFRTPSHFRFGKETRLSETAHIPTRTPMPPVPSGTSTPKSTRKLTRLTVALLASTKQGILNIYEAGKALHEAHRAKFPFIGEETKVFIEKFAAEAKGSVSHLIDLSDPDLALRLSMGSSLLSQVNMQIALLKVENPSKSGDTDDFDKLIGSMYYVKSKYWYPDFPPFTGLEMTSEGFIRGDKSAHILLRKNLFTLLGRACVDQQEIQKVSWLLPGDRYCRGQVQPFPQVLYNSLRDFFLEYLNLNHEELEVPFTEKFSSLNFLDAYEDLALKKKFFRTLSRARSKFLRETFHVELKEAIVEIRGATFTPAEPGCKFGTFAYRKRGTKRAADE